MRLHNSYSYLAPHSFVDRILIRNLKIENNSAQKTWMDLDSSTVALLYINKAFRKFHQHLRCVKTNFEAVDFNKECLKLSSDFCKERLNFIDSEFKLSYHSFNDVALLSTMHAMRRLAIEVVYHRLWLLMYVTMVRKTLMVPLMFRV